MGINIPPLEESAATLEIVGLKPLIMHKFSDKAKNQMLEKQMKKARKNETRDVEQEVEDATYYMEDGKTVGFPAAAIKKSLYGAGSFIPDLKKDRTAIRGGVLIEPDEESNGLIKVQYASRGVNEATVRLSGPGKVAMVRYRPEFTEWSMKLNITYIADVISLEQIIHLFTRAGKMVGLGERRPQQNGESFGTFYPRPLKSK